MSNPTNLCFIELALDGLMADKPFDGLTTSDRRGGPFIDILGREVEISVTDLQEMATNAGESLKATMTEGGELVGLPIDIHNHVPGDGAGWIVGVDLVGDVLRFTPRWTEVGRDLISRGIRRLFSATLDLTNNEVLGGSLTNWPAVRQKNGRLLLRPIELSNKLQVIDFVQEGSMLEEITFDSLPKGEQAKLRHQALVELQAELTAGEKTEPVDLEATRASLMEAMKTQARTELESEMAAELASQKKASDIAEFCKQVTGGTQDIPSGLPVQTDRLSAVLDNLDDENRAELVAILSETVEKGLVDFSESGHSRNVGGGRAGLDAATKKRLQQALDAGHTIDKFFELAAVLGSADDYDLSEFEGEK